MSPQREFSWTSPLVVSFLSFPSGFSPCLLRENFHGFHPQWFPFLFSPEELCRVSLRGNHGLCLQWFYILISPEDFYYVSSRENHRFCLQLLYTLYFLEDLHHLSLERTFTSFTLSGFHFHFTFKSPTILSSQGPLFTLLSWFVSVWTHEHQPTNGFVYWLSIFDAWEQLSRKRGTINTQFVPVDNHGPRSQWW